MGKNIKIGLALGSGGVHGLAHIGVLKQLDDFFKIQTVKKHIEAGERAARAKMPNISRLLRI